MMQTAQPGLDLIREFEGFHSEPYLDPIGIPTIGYGSTRDIDGSKITMQRSPVTESEGEELLAAHLGRETEPAIQALITAPLTQNQFDALSSFVYNLGSGNLKISTLRRYLNRLHYQDAADEFPKWRRAGGIILAGLVRRRAAERDLFLS